MTPKEKAILLIESMSFSNSRQMNYANGEMVDIPQNLYAKQCSLVAVDEIINAIRYTEAKSDLGYVDYWEQVKQEIKKL